jgi:hypothetical protein
LPLPPPACANAAVDMATSADTSSACEYFMEVSVE